MFAYLVVAIELAILYNVFWYVFIREPKPFKLGVNVGHLRLQQFRYHQI